jgi:hypothetical protein
VGNKLHWSCITPETRGKTNLVCLLCGKTIVGGPARIGNHIRDWKFPESLPHGVLRAVAGNSCEARLGEERVSPSGES